MGLSPFIRKVGTASGATAVQIAEKRHGVRRILEHLGSAQTEADLAVLMQVAWEKLNTGQQALDLEIPGAGAGPAAPPTSGAVVTGSACQVLWDMLTDAYARLGFDVLEDEAFKAMVLARIVEPASKLATTGILEELGMAAPHRNTLMNSLARCLARDYRGRIATACMAHSTAVNGAATMVLYDTTTLHFEVEDEDELRKVGMSTERRVDPQVHLGLLVDPGGFPLEVHLFEGNKAETTTLVPVLRQFQSRHGIADMVAVVDAGILSAANLNALEDTGFCFIVGSRITKAPYDLAEHFQRHGKHFTDGQTLDSVRTMGTGAKARDRRVVYQYSFKRAKRDNYMLNKQIEKAEKVASGQRPLKKDRFVKLAGKKPGVDGDLVDRARQFLGLKGYVTNLPAEKT